MGISLGGAVVRASHARNQAYYGAGIQPVDILVSGLVKHIGTAGLRAAVAQATQSQPLTEGK